jgi:hypothetical protein
VIEFAVVYIFFKHVPADPMSNADLFVYRIKMDGESLLFYYFGKHNVIDCFHSNFFFAGFFSIFISVALDFLQKKNIRDLFTT